MKKLFLASTALAAVMAAGSADAADVPVYKARPPMVAPWSWTGWYVGVHLGGAWGTKEWSNPFFPDDPTPLPFLNDLALVNYGVNGFIGGGQIGFNYQSGWVVWGVEAQASAANIQGSDRCPFFGGKVTCRTRVSALGSFAARLGGAVDRAMLYVKGGVAWAHEKHTLAGADFFFLGKSPTPEFFGDDSKHWRWGAMVGAGIEYAFTSSVSAKLEYNYMDFGKRTYNFLIDDVPIDVTVRQNLHLIKVAVNWRLDVGKYPVAARY